MAPPDPTLSTGINILEEICLDLKKPDPIGYRKIRPESGLRSSLFRVTTIEVPILLLILSDMYEHSWDKMITILYYFVLLDAQTKKWYYVTKNAFVLCLKIVNTKEET